MSGPAKDAHGGGGASEEAAAAARSLVLDVENLGIDDDFGLAGATTKPRNRRATRSAAGSDANIAVLQGESRFRNRGRRGPKPPQPSLERKRNALRTGKVCTGCGCTDQDNCQLEPREKRLWGFYKWQELILQDGEERLSWEQVKAKRQWTVVIWQQDGVDHRVCFELVTDSNTCFLDVKLWKGVYESEYTLSAWKVQVTACAVLHCLLVFLSVCR